MSIYDLLKEVVYQDATDLHLTPGLPPALRISQQLIPYANSGPLTPEACKELVYTLLNTEQKRQLETHIIINCLGDIPLFVTVIL